jgi:hypothetical protein
MAAAMLTGACQGGAVRDCIVAAPRPMRHCRCGRYRRTSGAPFVAGMTVLKEAVI